LQFPGDGDRLFTTLADGKIKPFCVVVFFRLNQLLCWSFSLSLSLSLSSMILKLISVITMLARCSIKYMKTNLLRWKTILKLILIDSYSQLSLQKTISVNLCTQLGHWVCLWLCLKLLYLDLPFFISMYLIHLHN
jgi:hypothetical protein